MIIIYCKLLAVLQYVQQCRFVLLFLHYLRFSFFYVVCVRCFEYKDFTYKEFVEYVLERKEPVVLRNSLEGMCVSLSTY